MRITRWLTVFLAACGCGSSGTPLDAGAVETGSDARLDSGSRDGGRDARIEAGPDGGRDAGPSGWEAIDEPVARACPLERATDPDSMFPVLDDWQECGTGCRELRVESLGPRSVFIDTAWYDQSTGMGYVSVLHPQDSRTPSAPRMLRIIGLDGHTRVAWRGFFGPDEDPCIAGGFRLGAGRWVLEADFLDRDPLESAIWQGTIEGQAGRPSATTRWNARAGGSAEDAVVGASVAAVRLSDGYEIGRLHPDGTLERFAADDRELIQRTVGVVGSDIVYSTYHARGDRFGVRVRTGSDVVAELFGDDAELTNPAASTDGSVIAWSIGVRSTKGIDGYGRVVIFESPFSAAPAEIRARRVAEIPGTARGLGIVGHGYLIMANDQYQMTIIRLSDGARWDLPPEPGTRLPRPLYTTPGELAYVYYEGTPEGRALAIRLLRWDALGPPDG